MSFDTSWDINKYIDPTELDQHWNLRKSFMETHKDKYPEQRLVSLAKLFTNIEFLGCNYNPELMLLVKHLSNDVDAIVEYRKSKQGKLQRTFVKASDAVKRNNPPNTNPASNKINFQPSSSNADTANNKINFEPSSSNSLKRNFETSNDDSSIEEKKFKSAEQTNIVKTNETFNQSSNVQNTGKRNRYQAKAIQPVIREVFNQADKDLLMRAKQQPGWRGQIIIFKVKTQKHLLNFNILMHSAERVGLVLKIEPDYEFISRKNIFKYNLMIGDEIITSCFTASEKKRTAREELGDKAMEIFQKYCFTVEEREEIEGTRIDKNITAQNSSKMPLWKQHMTQSLSQPLSREGIGAKMMKSMGWTGSGLGKDESGRKDPIEATVQVKRFGLGADLNVWTLRTKMTKYLEDYIKSQATHNLLFSTDFSKEERAVIHEVAKRFHLKSKSRGRDSERQLIVQRKLSPWQLVEDLLAAGGSSDSHILIRPTHV